MGKKTLSTNPKALESRVRIKTAKQEAAEKKKQEQEDAKWVETDKHVLAKEQRRKQDEEKKLKELQKRAELKALEEKEQHELAKYGKPKDQKLTRAMVDEQKEAEKQRMLKESQKKEKEEQEPEENINQKIRDEMAQLDAEGKDFMEARSVDAVLEQFTARPNADRHPEKRMKAAYLQYEEKNLDLLKQENPSLKLTQLKEILWKQWQKDPENPMNQKY